MDQYLKTMGTLGMHAGLVGFGEHYNSQFVNQTMSCVVFEQGGSADVSIQKTGKRDQRTGAADGRKIKSASVDTCIGQPA